MIESIDNLLGILDAQRGRELRFEVGQKARLITETGAFDVSPSPLTPGDIRNWIGPIVPESARQALTTNPGADFDYECHGIGAFKCTVARANGTMSFVFRPVGNRQTGAPPAPSQPRPDAAPPVRQAAPPQAASSAG